MSVLSDHSLLLDALLLGVSDEVYVLDAASMQLLATSASVLAHRQQSLAVLQQLPVESLVGVSLHELRAYSAEHSSTMQIARSRPEPGLLSILDKQTLNEQTLNEHTLDEHTLDEHKLLRIMTMPSPAQSLLLIFKAAALKPAVANIGYQPPALDGSEALFHAMVSNTPGLVFQFERALNGDVNFVYLSEGCQALLGLSVDALKQQPLLFYDLMNSRDREVLRRRLALSASKLSLLDWEGRVWIDGWHDIKWINVRAFPRLLANGSIQWVGIMMNITQSKNEKHEIEQSRRDLAQLTAHMEQIKEDERSRIAREIHDDVGGNLTVIKIGLAAIINRLKPEQNALLAQAQRLEAIVDNTFSAVHRIASDLRPSVLDLGIVAALEWQCREFERQLTISCQFASTQAEIDVSMEQAITLFRICQESMSNIAKHADATQVVVDLTANANEIVMTIRDNGIGINSADALKVNAFGLRGMQERVTALQGSFNITNRSLLGASGTLTTVRLPV
jgi:signal transduction histidine kinase